MKKLYEHTELSTTKRCLKCPKLLKKNSENKKLCYSCYIADKRKKYSNNQSKSNNNNLAKHFEIVKQYRDMKYTIKLKSTKAVSVFSHLFCTVPNIHLNKVVSLNTSDYNDLLKSLLYWE